jgi:hypothetical protein
MTNDEQLTVDLWLLDALLTQRDSRSGRGDENKIIPAEDFICGKLFYLSDGGYSRVYYSLSDTKLYLASESRPAVKTAWDFTEVKTVRLRIERRIRELVKESGE